MFKPHLNREAKYVCGLFIITLLLLSVAFTVSYARNPSDPIFSSKGVGLPWLSGYSSLPAAGTIWANSTNQKLMMSNGTKALEVGPSSGGGAFTCPQSSNSTVNWAVSNTNCEPVPRAYLYVLNDSQGLNTYPATSAGIITAYPTVTGLPTFSGHDCGQVVNRALRAIEATGWGSASIFIKAGDYYCDTGINLNYESLYGESGLEFATQLTFVVNNSRSIAVSGSDGIYSLCFNISGNSSGVEIQSEGTIQDSIVNGGSNNFGATSTGTGIILDQSFGFVSNSYVRGFTNGINVSSNYNQINAVTFGSISLPLGGGGNDIAVTLGAKDNRISNVIDTDPAGVRILDNSRQINYIETGQTGSLTCPTVTGGSMTNTAGDRIEVYWMITDSTVISKDGNSVSPTVTGGTVTVILNAGETTADSSATNTPVCFYN